MTSRWRSFPWRWILENLAVALVYYGAARFGLLLAFEYTNASPVWPPSGIALAAVLLLGYRVWPGIALGALFANTVVFHSYEITHFSVVIAVSISIAVGNTFEAVAGRFLLIRLLRARGPFGRSQSVFTFVAVTLLIAAISASIGPTSIALAGIADWKDYGVVWFTWWLGDATGILVVTPLLLTWAKWDKFLTCLTWPWQRYAEAALLLVSLVVASRIGFGGWLITSHYPLEFLPIPVLVWAAFRFGQRGATVGIAVTSAIAIWDTIQGRSAFVQATTNESLLLLQTFVGVTAVTILVLAATIAELRQTEERGRDSEKRLRLALEAARMGNWEWDISSNKVHWSASLELLHGLSPGSFGGTYAEFLQEIHPEDRAGVEQAIARTLNEGTEHHIEYRIIWPDDSIRWLEGRGHIAYQPDGKPARMTGVCMDITAQKLAEQSQQEHYNLLQAVIEGTTDAVFVKDRQGHYLMINTAGARSLGKTVEEVIGKDDTHLFSPETAAAIMAGDRRVMETGKVQTYEDVGTAAGITRTYLSTKGPYRDTQGNLVGIIGISCDITERKLAEQRLLAEHSVTRVLAESIDLEDAAPKILETICRTLNWDMGELWRVNRETEVLQRVGVWHVPTGRISKFERAGRRRVFHHGEGLPGHVWAAGNLVWIPNIAENTQVPGNSFGDASDLRAAFALPIRRNEAILGVLEFFSREIHQPGKALLDMMDSISRQIGQFMERREVEKKLHRRQSEFALARKIQQELLPHTAPALAGFDIGFASQSTQETGGDYLDFIPWRDGQLGIAIGDASGHGIAAALLMAETRAYLRALAETYDNVGTIITVANRLFASNAERDWFITLFLAKLNPFTNSLIYSSAGHCIGYLLDAQGQVKAVLKSTGMPLGIVEYVDHQTSPPVVIDVGDMLLLYTDGLTEAVSSQGRQFGVERLLKLVQKHHQETADAIVQQLFQSVRDFAGATPIDDETAIIVKRL